MATQKRLLLTLALASAAALSALPAHALGRLADVQVIDRDSGEILKVYAHKGEHWVAGRPGARYAVSMRNASRGRLLMVTSVDGVNVVSGESAAPDQTGYVLGPWQNYQITGWRKSDAEVAAFNFTASEQSYASRTGRPFDVGVIGVAVFREKAAQQVAPEPHYGERDGSNRSRKSAPSADSLDDRVESAPQSAAPAPAAAGRAESAQSDSRRNAPAKLGTGHGERETDVVSHTAFERRSARADEVVRIRYDSYANLVAMGVIPLRATPPRPNAFPGQPPYVPDPS